MSSSARRGGYLMRLHARVRRARMRQCIAASLALAATLASLAASACQARSAALTSETLRAPSLRCGRDAGEMRVRCG